MPHREVETTAYLDMLERMILAAGRRCADADEFELARLVDMRDVIERAIDTAVAGGRRRGWSWDWIGRALGCSKQTAHERYRDRVAA